MAAHSHGPEGVWGGNGEKFEGTPRKDCALNAWWCITFVILSGWARTSFAPNSAPSLPTYCPASPEPHPSQDSPTTHEALRHRRV